MLQYTEGVDKDLQVTNEKIGQMETAQIATNTKLAGLATSVAHVDRSLAALLRRFDELQGKAPSEKDEKNKNDWEDADYVADTELDAEDTAPRRRLNNNRRGMGGGRRREVHRNDDAFSKVKFKIPPFDGKYDLDAYITWEIAVDQKFACHEFP